MLGRDPRTAFAALVKTDSEGVQLETMDEKQLRHHVQRIVDAKEALRGDAAELVGCCRVSRLLIRCLLLEGNTSRPTPQAGQYMDRPVA